MHCEAELSGVFAALSLAFLKAERNTEFFSSLGIINCVSLRSISARRTLAFGRPNSRVRYIEFRISISVVSASL